MGPGGAAAGPQGKYSEKGFFVNDGLHVLMRQLDLEHENYKSSRNYQMALEIVKILSFLSGFEDF